MAGDYSILVGTTGAGLFHSPDSGQTWSRIGAPFPGESQIRALAVDPGSPNVVYAGSNNGIYRSEDSGDSWLKLDSPMEGLNIWSIAVDPADTGTIFVGTSPPFLFRSKDRGKSWEKLSASIAQECAIGLPRVTALLVDPVDRGTVLAGVEIDGVYRSRDGGDTWAQVDSGITNPDIHGMAFSLGEQKTVLVSTPREIFASRDDAETFQSLAESSSFAMPYCRWIAVKPDNPQVMFAANGDAAIGNTGTIQRSEDGGTVVGDPGRCRSNPIPRYGTSRRTLRTQTWSWPTASTGRGTAAPTLATPGKSSRRSSLRSGPSPGPRGNRLLPLRKIGIPSPLEGGRLGWGVKSWYNSAHRTPSLTLPLPRRRGH